MPPQCADCLDCAMYSRIGGIPNGVERTGLYEYTSAPEYDRDTSSAIVIVQQLHLKDG